MGERHLSLILEGKAPRRAGLIEICPKTSQ